MVPCTGGTDNDTGLFFPDFPSAADYCMEKVIPYLFEEDASGNYETTVWGQFEYRKLLYYKGFPGMSKPVFSVSVCSSVKIKGRDCGTINGHEESLSIRTLMKDARDILVRLTDTYILYNSQICLTGSNPLSSTSCS